VENEGKTQDRTRMIKTKGSCADKLRWSETRYDVYAERLLLKVTTLLHFSSASIEVFSLVRRLWSFHVYDNSYTDLFVWTSH